MRSTWRGPMPPTSGRTSSGCWANRTLQRPPSGSHATRVSAPFSIAPAGPLDPIDASLGLTASELTHLELTELGQGLSIAMGLGKAAASVAFAVGAYPLAAPSATAVGHGVGATAEALGAAASGVAHQAATVETMARYEHRPRRQCVAVQYLGRGARPPRNPDPREPDPARHSRSRPGQQRETARAGHPGGRVPAQREVPDPRCPARASRAGERTPLRHAPAHARALERRLRAAYELELGEAPPPDELSSPLGFRGSGDLLTGRRLQHELARLLASFDQKRAQQRDALVMRVSLRKHDPAALLELRATGVCTFSITEPACDLHNPGQWDRRIKAVLANVHCVVGSNETLDCILTRSGGVRRTSDRVAPGSTLVNDPPGVDRIPINSGRRDSGQFEFNLNDDLLVPGENRGLADSTWTLEIATPFRGYDPGTIADVGARDHVHGTPRLPTVSHPGRRQRQGDHEERRQRAARTALQRAP